MFPVVWLIDPNIDWKFLTCAEFAVSCNAVWVDIINGRPLKVPCTALTAGKLPAVSAVQGDCETVYMHSVIRTDQICSERHSAGPLTHWGRVTHICISKLTIIGSDNGLLPSRRQAIIWTNAGILLIRLSGTNFSEILIEIDVFSFKKMHLKMSSAKCGPFCLGLNVVTPVHRQWSYHSLVLSQRYIKWYIYSASAMELRQSYAKLSLALLCHLGALFLQCLYGHDARPTSTNLVQKHGQIWCKNIL